MDVIYSRAPVRIDFSGGASDLMPYAQIEGGTILNATISYYIQSSIRKRSDSSIFINGIEYKNYNSLVHDGNFDIIKSILIIAEIKSGLDIRITSDIPLGSGLGSSGALTVSFIGSLKKVLNEEISILNIAEFARGIESDYFGVYEGGQDQYASALGGFNFMKFDGNNIEVESLNLPSNFIHSLNERLILCYCGQSRNSDNISKEVMKSYLTGNNDTFQALKMLKKFAEILKYNFISGDFESFEKTIQEIFLCQTKLHKSVLTEKVISCMEVGIASGAKAGKIVGAGGGGCILFYCSTKKRNSISKNLLKNGYLVLPFKFVSEGLTLYKL